jgi:hypothetical protein
MTKQKSEFPRGYKVNQTNKILNIGGMPARYDVYVVEHKSLKYPKTFLTREAVDKFINETEREKLETKALKVSGYQHIKGVVSAHKDSIAAIELTEIAETINL